MTDGTKTKDDEYICCPYCHMEFRLVDLEPTLDKGHFKCHVCKKKFPSPLPHHQYTPPVRNTNYFSLICTVVIVLIAAGSVYFYLSASKIPAAPQLPSRSTPAPAQVKATSVAGHHEPSEKFKMVKRIAEEFHKSHTYTMEDEFVCLDMAIGVWNQLITTGIDAKIFAGNVQEDISGWNYEQLVGKCNHAWVVARISPTEKVAVETTGGKVFSSDTKLASAYFKGIVFDNPAQIKKFESLRKKASEVCPEANKMIDDWNNNVAGKQRRSEANIAKQSRIEQRRHDCENTINQLNKFKFRAIFRN